MDTKKKQSVIPIYAVGLVWLSRAISGHLSSFGGIISTIVLSAVAFGVLKIFFPDKVEQTDGADKSAPNAAKPEEKKQPEPKQDSTPKPEGRSRFPKFRRSTTRSPTSSSPRRSSRSKF